MLVSINMEIAIETMFLHLPLRNVEDCKHTTQKDAQHFKIQLQAFHRHIKDSIPTFLKYPQNINPTICRSYCSKLCNNVAPAGLHLFVETTIHCFLLTNT
jgi:hypothetical protein